MPDLPPSFDTIDEAARAAYVEIQKKHDFADNEYIGLIYEDPKTGKLRITDFQSSSGDRSKTSGTFNIPKGSLRALIHNHPGKDRNVDFLSAQDVDMATQLDVPSYIGVGNRLLRWTGKTKGGGSRLKGITEEVPTVEEQSVSKKAFQQVLESQKEPSLSAMFQENK